MYIKEKERGAQVNYSFYLIPYLEGLGHEMDRNLVDMGGYSSRPQEGSRNVFEFFRWANSRNNSFFCAWIRSNRVVDEI